MKFFITSCNKSIFNLQGLAYLFNKFWTREQEVTVLCFDELPENLPDNFKVVSLGPQEKFGKVYTTPLIPIFSELEDGESFYFTLDDCWLFRPVNFDALDELLEYVPVADRIGLHNVYTPSDMVRNWTSYEQRKWSVYKHPILKRKDNHHNKFFSMGYNIFKKEYWMRQLLRGPFTSGEFESKSGHAGETENYNYFASLNYPCHYRDVWWGAEKKYRMAGYPEPFPRVLLEELDSLGYLLPDNKTWQDTR